MDGKGPGALGALGWLSGLLLGLSAAGALGAEAMGHGTERLDTILVEAAREAEPLTRELAVQAATGPVGDLSELLRALPGIGVSRLGGTAGAPLLRGLGGPRLPVVANGAEVGMACNHGMDPPTAYLQADAYDRIRVIRGPYTVQNGPALGGGIVLERDPPPAGGEDAATGRLDLELGSFDRHRLAASARLARGPVALRAGASRAGMNDFRDGDGVAFHAFNQRWNASLGAVLALDAHTRLELDRERGDAEAAFPAFHMDGTRFRRELGGLRLVRERPGATLSRLELLVRDEDIRHQMDDFSLRPVHVELQDLGGGNTLRTTSRLTMRQDTSGRAARLALDLALGETAQAVLGGDWRQESHDASNHEASETCLTLAGVENCIQAAQERPFYDLRAIRRGVFAELTQAWETSVLKAGLRGDRLATRAGALWDFPGTTLLPGAYSSRRETSGSAFLRLEHMPGEGLTTFLALGYAERPASNLERASFNGFYLEAERNREVDLGASWRAPGFSASLSLFESRIDDFILTYQGTSALNVDALRRGGEAELQYQPAAGWRLGLALAWLHGENRSQDAPLAQTPPREARLSLERGAGALSGRLELRLVDGQERVQVGYGNSLGVDLGPTPGFATVAVSLAWHPRRDVWLSAGVDNLLDRAYAEHVSRTGAFAPSGFLPTTRVNEPGRALWLRLRIGLG